MICDIMIVDRASRLGQPGVRVGIMPGAGGTQRLVRAVGKARAMHLCMTAAIIDGPEAVACGLASVLAADGEVLAEAMRTAEKIASMPPIAIQQIKEVILAGADAPLGTALALERKAVQLLFATADKTEGMAAFLEKRRPSYTGR